ncbi:hypothetical protein GCM10011416_02150 [Polaribacter pacificus]|uniref:LUD domain-containing protein n=1 Tax=Polaribacter pacificus TaxID=1775173 RepID=A0A917MAH0_9FLAO|nr:LUD domain-containing protein [Polaribacter pacificus]GGG89339.1 hypothetical protein GCM10011416_02150 [Polaribacter pacificus]
MSFFKKVFNLSSEKPQEKEAKKQEVHLSLDDAFVHNFLEKGGKFLYCTKKEEILIHLKNIISENQWDELICTNPELIALSKSVAIKTNGNLKQDAPFFTTCEHLIADNGDILFSSNQLQSERIASLSDHFIVYATTSQLVKNTGEGLTGIKTNCKKNIPTNISSVKNYTLNKNEDNFLNYGNNSSKDLYLLLYEDL